MKIILFLSLCYSLTTAQQTSSKKLPAFAESHLINLHEIYSKELQCLKRFDAILTSKWTRDLERIDTKYLGTVEPESIKFPSKLMYNAVEQEWLMESGSTSNQIGSCFRNLVSDIVPLTSQAEKDCLNSIFAIHIKEEIAHEDMAKESLRTQNREQLPFRRFISFSELVELMFQSRTPDALSGVERTVHEHAESFLTTEKERTDPTYIMEQECEWKNARALREAPNADARLNEFARQVRDSVKQQLANRVLRNWNLNGTLSRDKYVAWVKARENLTPQLNAEVELLRNQKKDAQWLCEHATKFAYKMSDEEGDIILGEDNSLVQLEASNIAKKARGIEKALEKTRDFQYPVVKSLADQFEDGTTCVSAFLHLLQNHRRFNIALAFADGRYTYPEFYCKEKNTNLGLIATKFCKCVGSFCVSHPLAALFAEEYDLVQAPDGRYRVVLSGVKSRKKVQQWK